MKSENSYCVDPFNRVRLRTSEVKIGNITLGGENPIRVQSMTTTDTMDTEGSIEQSIRMIEAGSELVRLTAPSKKEAENLAAIKAGLVSRGYNTPLVADIHFTPNAAEIAAAHVEKVRVNPGNFADKKKFEEIQYTDESYKAELKRIEEKFTPLVLLCKENGTALRIGTNHGSLSDRILSRYGDTPEGMVASAIEFIEVCRKNDFHNMVISMKASNTLVMVQAYRLLVKTMHDNGYMYPLHLGVTEAGDGEDGRIKSAVGIGALLEDGIGDTIRVSLTEEPEAEIPVAQKLLSKFDSVHLADINDNQSSLNYSPFHYTRRVTKAIHIVGDHHVPVVIADLSKVDNIKPSHLFGYGYNYSVPLDKWNIGEMAADFLFIGSQTLNFELPGTLKCIVNFDTWEQSYKNKDGFYPIIDVNETVEKLPENYFLKINTENCDINEVKKHDSAIFVLTSTKQNKTQDYRKLINLMVDNQLNNPVILQEKISSEDPEIFQLWSGSTLGSLLIDGFGDGIWLTGAQPSQLINSTSFGILQATRTRISKTEYISCPSCGRTLFDLQETTAKIRAKTDHLKGVKIGIMGCIVNGPGEMADADYGYVGTRPGKIHLYKEQTVVQKNVPEEEAVDALIALIKEHGDWIEPKNN